MQKAVFCDRDGVINIDYGYIGSIDRFDFVPDVKQALACLKNLGYLTVLVTNQSGIARGIYKEADFLRTNAYMQQCLDLYNARFDKVYFCPHHKNAQITKYRKVCNCRKPNPGMLLQAAIDLNIDLSSSIMVGDKESDLKAGISAGIGRCIFISENKDCLNTSEIGSQKVEVYASLAKFVEEMKKNLKKIVP